MPEPVAPYDTPAQYTAPTALNTEAVEPEAATAPLKNLGQEDAAVCTDGVCVL
ncbi:hypothetical protein ACFY1L_37890 [Streptomyces sp. NPDC001663]|uniref:hypothetical protein n=1 Tax=Streptomyces sp. NPDC001663 TaxID=3364597 RepID=UPI00368EBE6B